MQGKENQMTEEDMEIIELEDLGLLCSEYNAKALNSYKGIMVGITKTTECSFELFETVNIGFN